MTFMQRRPLVLPLGYWLVPAVLILVVIGAELWLLVKTGIQCW